MTALNDTFTSTGHKFFAHQEAMTKLRNGKGQPIVTHVMLTDICNHTCAFCSVQHRAGDSLPFANIMTYIDVLRTYGLKAVILSGGGNPILCHKDGRNFNDVVDALYSRGLQIGLITNGMPMRLFGVRESWQTVTPETLDKLTWIRISMAGLDHDEREVYVPDIDPSKTTLGFSYVAHDIYEAPEDKAHGKVSTEIDLINLHPKYLTQLEDGLPRNEWRFEDRLMDLEAAFTMYCQVYKPKYLRLLPNCLEPPLIAERCEVLRGIAFSVNTKLNREVVFVQNKPPKAPHACYLGYIHPVLNCDGYVYPCDSCVLNEAAGHQFANPWRVCHWSEIAQLYDRPVKSLIADPAKTCPGCVFSHSNDILESVVDGTADLTPPNPEPEHVNFV